MMMLTTENNTQLSTDLNIITTEINSYKNIAGQSVYEIGRRLKEVKDNPDRYGIPAGTWSVWVKENFGFTDTHANMFVKVVDRFKDNMSMYQLGVSVLNEMISFTDEQLKQEQYIPSKDTVKPYEEMSRRELIEVRKALKKAEDELEAQRIAAETPAPVLVVEKVVDNTDHEAASRLEQMAQELAATKLELEAQLNSPEYELNKVQREEEAMKHKAHISTYELQIKINRFLQEAAPNLYLQGAIAVADPMVRKELMEATKALETFVDNLKDLLSAKIRD